MRKFLVSAVVVLIAVTFATAEQYTGLITGLEKKGDKTYVNFKKIDTSGGGGGGFGKGEATSLELDANCKFYKASFNIEEKKLDKGEEIKRADFEKQLEEAKAKAAAKAKDAKDAGGKGGKGGKGGAIFGGGGFTFGQVVTAGTGEKEKVTEVHVMDLGGLLGKFKKKDGD